MYTRVDFNTKKALKSALALGHKIEIFQPGPFGGNEPKNGTTYLEGPHYPKPHTWYAEAKIVDGFVVRVK